VLRSIELGRILAKTDDEVKRAELERERTDRLAATKTSQRSRFQLCHGYHERVEPFIMYYLLKTALDDALNPGFKTLLLATGDAKLVWQAPRNDTNVFSEGIFGLGPSGDGKNLYGIALMKHRDELRQVLEEEARTAASESAPLPAARATAPVDDDDDASYELVPDDDDNASGLYDDDGDDDVDDGNPTAVPTVSPVAHELLNTIASNIVTHRGQVDEAKYRQIKLCNRDPKFVQAWSEVSVQTMFKLAGWIVDATHVRLPDGTSIELLLSMLDAQSAGKVALVRQAVHADTPAAQPSVSKVSRPTTMPPWGGHAAQATSVPSASKAEHDRQLKIRKDRRVQQEKDVQARRRVTSRAAAVGMQPNSVDQRGHGEARAKRKVSSDARSAAESTAAQGKKPKSSKPCAYFATGDDNKCRNGDGCPREHGPHVSDANISNWLRKAANAASGINKVRPGQAPVKADSIRMGRIYSYNADRGFGWITPDQKVGRGRTEQRIFFHVNDWVGSATTKPTGAGDAHRRVRYVRVEDDRDRSKWKAKGVSALQ
jgi:predicted NAD-dependent protein-ADP-ribosyltransferase YbiA (DUF1768 family)